MSSGQVLVWSKLVADQELGGASTQSRNCDQLVSCYTDLRARDAAPLKIENSLLISQDISIASLDNISKAPSIEMGSYGRIRSLKGLRVKRAPGPLQDKLLSFTS